MQWFRVIAGGTMNKKYAVILLFALLPLILFCVKEDENTETEPIPKTWDVIEVDINAPVICGRQPVICVQSASYTENSDISHEDKQILYKIVEAEAGNEDRIGKILVANVILNRLEDKQFPDTIEEVVYQRNGDVVQFSPVANGSFESAVPDEDTIEAVDAALTGEDYSQGALFFAARLYADDNKMRWFDENLEKVLEHGGHEFYR